MIGLAALGGLGAGIIEGENRWATRRLEVARAFNEFKRANPYATYEEWQAFINQTVGPNQFLRGGWTDDVIQRIAEENAKAKAQADFEARIQAVSKQADAQQKIIALAESLAANEPNDEVVFDKIAQMLGGTPEIYAQVRNMLPQGGIASIRARGTNKLINDLLPSVTDQMRDGGELNLDVFGLDEATKKRIGPILQSRAEKSLQLEYDQMEKLYAPEIRNAISKGIQPTIPSYLPKPVQERLRKMIETEGPQIAQELEYQREIALADAATKIISEYRQDPGILRAQLEGQGEAALRAQVRQDLELRLRGVLKGNPLPDGYVDNIVKRILDLSSATQYATNQKNLQEVGKVVDDQLKKQIEVYEKNIDSATNVDKMQTLFGNNAAVAHAASTAIRTLARQYYLSGDAINAIYNAYNKRQINPANPLNEVEHRKLIAQIPEVARDIKEGPLNQRITTMRKEALERQGYFEGVGMTFEQFQSGVITSARTYLSGHRINVQEALQDKDPNRRLTKLHDIKLKLLASKQKALQQIEGRAKRAPDWIKPGSRWDLGQFFELGKIVGDEFDALIREVDELERVQKTPTPAAPATEAAPPPPPPQQPQLIRPFLRDAIKSVIEGRVRPDTFIIPGVPPISQVPQIPNAPSPY